MPLISTIAIAYLLGALAGANMNLPPAATAAAALAALAAALHPKTSQKTFAALMCAASFSASLFSMNVDTIVYDRMPIRNYIKQSEKAGVAEAVTGVVKSAPAISNGALRFELDVQKVRVAQGLYAPCPGRLAAVVPITASAGQKPPLYGDLVTIEGRMYGLDRLSPRIEPRYRSADIAGFIRTPPGYSIINHGAARVFPLPRWGAMLREKISESLRLAVGDKWFPIIGQMLFGAGPPIPDDIQEQFRTTGTIHVLVVSGQQVMLMLGAFLLLSFLWKRSVWGTIPIVGTCLVMYFAMTGGGPSITRALVMGMIFLICAGTGRTYDPLAALSWAAVALCVANPWTIFNAGAQLSFAACLGLGIIYPRVSWLAPRHSVMRRPSQAALLSTSAQFPLFPLLAYYFGAISVISPVANLFIVPVAGVALPYGLVAGGLCALWHGFIPVLGPPLRAMMWLLVSLVKVFAAVPLCTVPTSPPGPLHAILYMAVGAGVLWFAAAMQNGRREHVTPAILLSGIPASLLCLLFLFKAPTTDMRVTFLDVGEGDSALIEAPCRPGGRPISILVDAGGSTRAANKNPYDPGRWVVAPAMRRRNIGMLDMLVVSHPDADHLGGAPYILQNTPVAFTSAPGFDPGTALFKQYRELVREKGVRAAGGGDGLTAGVPGCVELDFLYPPRALLPLGRKSTNEISQTFVLRFGDTKILFSGDIGQLGEQQLLERHRRDIHADIIKIPHHGSGTSSSRRFLRAVNPSVAVISAGRGNMYGHPSRAVLARLDSYRIKTYRTDLGGDITVTIPRRGKNFTASPEFAQPDPK